MVDGACKISSINQSTRALPSLSNPLRLSCANPFSRLSLGMFCFHSAGFFVFLLFLFICGVGSGLSSSVRLSSAEGHSKSGSLASLTGSASSSARSVFVGPVEKKTTIYQASSTCIPCHQIGGGDGRVNLSNDG